MMSSSLRSSPYVGPRAFDEADQAIFFGRDDESRQLAALVIAHRAVLLYAQSGAGKTSLLQASLVPALKRRKKVVALPIGRVAGETRDDVANVFVYNALLSIYGEEALPDELASQSLSQGLAWRKPLGLALFIYGGLSLAGAPLTPGFAGRWALIINSQSPPGLSMVILVISVIVGVVGLLRFLAKTLSKKETGSEIEISPESNLSRIVARGLLLLGIFLAFFPQLILSLSRMLANPF